MSTIGERIRELRNGWPTQSELPGQADARLVAVLRELIVGEAGVSTGTRSLLIHRARKRLADQFGTGVDAGRAGRTCWRSG